MLILQIAIGIVLGVLLLAYLGEIIVLGFGAMLILVALSLIALVGFFLYEAISLTFILSLISVLALIFVLSKFFQSNWYIKKMLKKQIKKREDLGYTAFDLHEKLKTIESNELVIISEKKVKADAMLKMKDEFKALSKTHSKSVAKEIARRKSLGYKE